MAANLDYFLRPKSIAVIGASATPGRVGYVFTANLIDCDFPGKIFPVNPRLDEVRGTRVYPNLKCIPDKVDLAILAVQPSAVPDIVRECGEKGVKAILISSAGFADGDANGKQLEHKVVEIAKEHGIRIIGPNTQGYMNLDAKLVVLSMPTPSPLIKGRGLSFVCQSGFFYWDWIFRNPSLGFNKAIDLGDMCDVNHADFLEYLGDDPETSVIVLHIEGLKGGRRFMETVSKITPKKPVIALKAGRYTGGAQAVASHTGTLAGKDEVYDAAFRQAGIIRAVDMHELTDVIKVFALFPTLPDGNRVGIISFSGAAGSLAADACEEFGLELAGLSPATIEKLKQILPAWAGINNPLDLFPVVEVEAKVSYEIALGAFSADPNIDAIILATLTASSHKPMNAVEVFHKYAEEGPSKPTIICGLIDDEWLKELSSLELKGIVTYPTVERAVKALAAAYSRYKFLYANKGDNR